MFTPDELKGVSEEHIISDAKMVKGGADATEKGDIDPSEKQEKLQRGDTKVDLMEGFSEDEERLVSKIMEYAGIDRSQVSEALKSYKLSFKYDLLGSTETHEVTLPRGGRVILEWSRGGPTEDRFTCIVDGKYVIWSRSNFAWAAYDVVRLHEKIYGK